MKSNTGIFILILVVVCIIIIPTLFLLWFMEQAVKNEHLAVKQKLINIYKEKVNKVTWDFSDLWLSKQQINDLGNDLSILDNIHQLQSDGMVIYDSENNKVLYPYEKRTDADNQSKLFKKV